MSDPKIPEVSAEATARALRHPVRLVRGDERAVATFYIDGTLYLQGVTEHDDEPFRGAQTDVWMYSAKSWSYDPAPSWGKAAAACAADGWRIDPTDRVGRACLAWALEESDPKLWWVASIVARVQPDETLGAEIERHAILSSNAERRAQMRAMVDLLAHLDPTDPRLLPDGSRWVDAAALVLIANHVLREGA